MKSCCCTRYIRWLYIYKDCRLSLPLHIEAALAGRNHSGQGISICELPPPPLQKRNPEKVFFNLYGAQESIPPAYVARHNPIPTGFLALTDCSKIRSLNLVSSLYCIFLYLYLTCIRVGMCWRWAGRWLREVLLKLPNISTSMPRTCT